MSRKIILKQHQSPGDILVFTRALGDLKESYPDYQIDVRSPCPEIFENNPRLTPLKEEDEDVEIFDITYPEVNNSGWNGIHFTEAFTRNVEEQLGVSVKRTGLRPEIWISDEEQGWINQVESEFGYKGKFWLINAGYKPDCFLKYYPYWQEVVRMLQDKVQFVQVGNADHIHPELDGVFNLVGKTDLRQLIRLAYWAEGTVGPISFQMHLSGAFEQPAVVVAGGKEPVRWEMYPNHRYLAVNGCLKCAPWDGCWKSKKEECVNLTGGYPRCFTMIKPKAVAEAVVSYYEGGMLTY